MRLGISEAELATKVVTELQRQNFVVYQEVSTGYGARRADIVAIRGPVLAVVECKVNFSLKLLDQLAWWKGYGNLVIGASGFTKMGQAAHEYLLATGIGLWTVMSDEIHEEVAPRLLRRANTDRLRKALRPEQQSAEYAKAGTQGGYWTPFRGTCDALRNLVAHKPGIALKDALKEVGHHYASVSSAMSSIPALIRTGVIVGIRVEDGRPLRLFPVTAPLVNHELKGVEDDDG